MSGRDRLLELRGVHASYGPFKALFGVDLRISKGQVVALLGPNGAGKSSVARVIAGLVRPTSGAVAFDGHDLTRLAPWQITRLGITYAPEGRATFSSLTVEENLRLVFGRVTTKRAVDDAIERVMQRFPRLAERRRQAAGTLSGGEQRMLVLARAFGFPPRLVIVDELSLGLAPAVTDEVWRGLHAIRDEGCALLVVEQHVRRAIELADKVVLLDRGRVRAAGPAREMSAAATDYLSSAG